MKIYIKSEAIERLSSHTVSSVAEGNTTTEEDTKRETKTSKWQKFVSRIKELGEAFSAWVPFITAFGFFVSAVKNQPIRTVRRCAT